MKTAGKHGNKIKDIGKVLKKFRKNDRKMFTKLS